MKLCIVTASTNLERAAPCVETWRSNSLAPLQIVMVVNGQDVLRHGVPGYDIISVGEYLGSVPAFRKGVAWALEHSDADVICCFHDDLEIHQSGWDRVVLSHFQRHPECGLAGFGGALGLGDADIYQKPYKPEQLARVNFRSNLVDAEVHGIRSLVPEQVSALDGFSLIGRRDFYNGITPHHSPLDRSVGQWPQPWTLMEEKGLIHHAYDGVCSMLAAQYDWEVWYLPVRCRHHGGQTAVGDPGYQDWAKAQNGVGDQQFWIRAHEIFYEMGKLKRPHGNSTLPLRV